MKKLQSDGKSKPELLRYLPSEIIIDILSRLPIRTILICKSVCRSWRDLLCSRYFVDFHLSKSVPGLIVNDGLFQSNSFRILEYDDADRDLPYKLVSYIEPPRYYDLRGSVNGLLLLSRRVPGKCHIPFVCNPITREYIQLPDDSPNHHFVGKRIFAYGFGVSRMTGQYKVVMILQDYDFRELEFFSIRASKSICLVYTLGTGMWRSITPMVPFSLNAHEGLCVNGNIHWLVRSSYRSFCISVLDLDSETFSTLSVPTLAQVRFVSSLLVLRGCLCVCDAGGYGDEIAIWLMKEYGDEKSWTKELVVRKSYGLVDLSKYYGVVCTIKVLQDGDILMAWRNMYMIRYSNKTKTIKQIELVGDDDMFKRYYMRVLDHTSSFFPLTSFANENVSRF